MITFQTACKFPGVSCRVQPWVIHLVHARWQVAGILTFPRVRYCRSYSRDAIPYTLQECGLIVPTYWVTGSHLLTRMECKKNILVNATFQLRPKHPTSQENWRKHVLFWMNEVTWSVGAPGYDNGSVYARLERCPGKSLWRVSHKLGYPYSTCPRTAKKALFRQYGITTIRLLVYPYKHKWTSHCQWLWDFLHNLPGRPPRGSRKKPAAICLD
jgi:hypothetical protein